jgi:hypothetical protein
MESEKEHERQVENRYAIPMLKITWRSDEAYRFQVYILFYIYTPSNVKPIFVFKAYR